jgi:hypothetical protein
MTWRLLGALILDDGSTLSGFLAPNTDRAQLVMVLPNYGDRLLTRALNRLELLDRTEVE